MTEQEHKAKDAARKREAYRRRKEAQADLSNKLPLPQEAALKVAKANGIDVQPSKKPTPDHEEAWRIVQTNGKPISAEEIVDYVDSRERAQAVMAEAVAREESVNMLFEKFERCTNIPQLLQAILREQITLRVTLTDLIGSLRK